MDMPLAELLHAALVREAPALPTPEALQQGLEAEWRRQFVAARRRLFAGFLLLVYVPGVDSILRDPPQDLGSWFPRLIPLFLLGGVIAWGGIPRKQAALPLVRRFREVAMIRAGGGIVLWAAGLLLALRLLPLAGWDPGAAWGDLDDVVQGGILALTVPLGAWALFALSRAVARRLDPYWF